MILAIDPGIDTGWAVFSNGSLHSCGLGSPALSSPFVIIELPQIYTARLMKGDPNDLITLAVQVGQYKERYESKGSLVKLVRPQAWKGQVPKDVHHRRIELALSEDERRTLARFRPGVPKSKQHNMLDAVGLGQWAVKSKAFCDP